MIFSRPTFTIKNELLMKSKKKYPFRGIGVPTQYLLPAVMGYIAFGVAIMCFAALALKSIGQGAINDTLSTAIPALICMAIITFVTKRYFHTFANKGVSKNFTTLNPNVLKKGLTRYDLKGDFTFEVGEANDTGGTYYMPTSETLLPLNWLKGDTACTVQGNSMRRTIPVYIRPGEVKLTPVSLNGQRFYVFGAHDTILFQEGAVPQASTEIGSFSSKKNAWL